CLWVLCFKVCAVLSIDHHLLESRHITDNDLFAHCHRFIGFDGGDQLAYQCVGPWKWRNIHDRIEFRDLLMGNLPREDDIFPDSKRCNQCLQLRQILSFAYKQELQSFPELLWVINIFDCPQYEINSLIYCDGADETKDNAVFQPIFFYNIRIRF